MHTLTARRTIRTPIGGALRALGIIAAALLAPLSVTAPAGAQTHVALVIGNAAYRAAPPVRTGEADAGLVAETLRAAGYDVTEFHNLAQANTGQVLREFLGKVAAA